jgi:RNA polymerase sigma factor (sigma-70 family)
MATRSRYRRERGAESEHATSTDEELIAQTRAGSSEAYGELWVRHEKVAAAVARSVSSSSAEDLVAEAFARVLRVLRTGRGPTENFRAYLCTTVRSCSVDEYRRSRHTVALGLALECDAADLAAHQQRNEEACDEARAAWATLNQREQWLMWASAVAGYSTGEMAERLGAKPGTVAVWAFRARERLRAAFLAGHVERTDNAVCQAQRDRFIGYLRDSLSAKRGTELSVHLEVCPDCSQALSSVSDVHQRLRVTVWPLLPLANQSVISHLRFAPGGHVLARHAAMQVMSSKAVAIASAASVAVGAASVVIEDRQPTAPRHVIGLSQPVGLPSATRAPDGSRTTTPTRPTPASPARTHPSSRNTSQGSPTLSTQVSGAPLSPTSAAPTGLPNPSPSTKPSTKPSQTPSVTASPAPPPVPEPGAAATPAALQWAASASFAIVVPDPASASGTVTVTLPSGWSAISAAAAGITGLGAVGYQYFGNNVVTMTFSIVRVDPSTRTLRLTVSGVGPMTAGASATAKLNITGLPRQTVSATLG